MKIENNKTLLDYIDNLQTINDLNMSLSEMFLSIIDNDEIVSKEELETLSKTYNRSLKEVYIDKIIDYDSKRARYKVLYEGGETDSIPISSMREGRPTRLSLEEMKFWSKIA